MFGLWFKYKVLERPSWTWWVLRTANFSPSQLSVAPSGAKVDMTNLSRLLEKCHILLQNLKQNHTNMWQVWRFWLKWRRRGTGSELRSSVVFSYCCRKGTKLRWTNQWAGSSLTTPTNYNNTLREAMVLIQNHQWYQSRAEAQQDHSSYLWPDFGFSLTGSRLSPDWTRPSVSDSTAGKSCDLI